jgi:hypothetical protein
VVGTVATFTELQPGAWTFTTSGGPALTIPHLDITNGSFQLVAGGGVATVTPTNGTLTRYAKITGLVELTDYDQTTDLPEFQWGADGAALSVSSESADAGTAQIVLGADGSSFIVWSPTASTWDLEIARDHFVSVTRPVTATVGQNVSAGTIELFPAPRDVTVKVTSAAGDITGLTLEATAPVGTGLAPVTAVVNGDGEALFELLVPGTWTFSTVGGPSLTVPHVETSAEVLVPIGTSALTIADPIITYLKLTGAVQGKDNETAAPAALAGVAVTVTQPVSTGSTVSTASSGDPATWTVGVVAGSAIGVTWTKVGYQTENRTLAAPLVLDTLVVSDITLTALTRDVTVTVSGAPNGLKLRASLTGLSAVEATVSGQKATFVGLAPGSWSVASIDGAELLVLDFADVALNVPVAATDLLDLEISTPLVVLHQLVVSVSGVNFEGAAGPVLLEGASVTVSADSDTVNADTSATGVVTILVSAGRSVTVKVAAAHYVSPAATTLDVNEAVTNLDVTLIAEVRSVKLTVGSSASATSYAGLTIQATPTTAGTPSVDSQITDAAGQVTFSLAPGEWTFSVSGAESLVPPHLNVGPASGSTNGAPLTTDIAVGDPLATVTRDLTLQPLDATVTGRVLNITGDDEEDQVPVKDVTVIATSGDFSRSDVTDENGEYSIAISSDRAWTITTDTTGFDGATSGTVDPGSGETAELDLLLSVGVRNIGGQITGVTGQVTVTATANGYGSVQLSVAAEVSGTPYSFAHLNSSVTWTITFSDGTTTVTRFVGPGGNVTNLNQDLAAASVGDIEINLTDAGVGLRTDPLEVRVTLTDPNAFPQFQAPLVDTVTLPVGQATSTVTFNSLAIVDGDPFEVQIDILGPVGYATVEKFDALPGETYETTLSPSDRIVELTLTKNGDPVSGVQPQLTRTINGTIITLNSSVEANVATFTGVAPGEWQVVATGYGAPTVSVPIGNADQEVEIPVALTGIAESIKLLDGDTEITGGSLELSEAQPLTVTVQLLDRQGDLMPFDGEVTVNFDPSSASAGSPVTMSGGVATLTITRSSSGSVLVTFMVSGKSATLTLTDPPPPPTTTTEATTTTTAPDPDPEGEDE